MVQIPSDEGSNPVATTIDKAEYFFNTDPGVGNGFDIPLSNVGDSAWVSNTPVAHNLPVGWHQAYIRVRDVTGKWSTVESHPFLVQIPSEGSTPVATTIDKAEYFFDTDLGVGNGFDLPLSMIGDSIAIRDLAVSVGSLTIGLHLMYIRVRDVTGKWSTLEPQPIRIVETVGETAAALHFDGSNDYITLPNTLSTAATSGDAITIEYWFKGTNMESAVRLDGNGSIVAGYNNTHYISNDGQLAIGSTALDGNWHHIAMTWQRNTTNGYKSYLDGVLVAQKDASNTPLPSANSGVRLGSITGSMDELRIWNRAVAQCEIQNNMNCELPLGNARNGLLGYYQFNQGVAFGENDIVTTLLDESAYANHGTLNNFALTGITSNWTDKGGVTTGVSCSANYPSVAITITTGSQTISYGASVTFEATFANIGASPTYQWKKNGVNVGTSSPTYTDALLFEGDLISCVVSTETCSAISNSLKMTVTNPPAAASLRFDGTNDYVTLPNSFAMAASTGNAITIEYWFKGTTLQSALRMEESNSSGYGYIISGNDNGYHSISTEANRNILIGATATDGNWHHIAMTWQRNTTNGFTSYLDGNIVEQRNSSDVPLPLQTGNVTLGSYRGQGIFMNGSLDEVRIWNRALPQSEIQSTMNCELGCARNGLLAYYRFNQGIAYGDNPGLNELTDDSGNGYNGTLTNFALTGRASNWAYLGGVTTGTSCTEAATPSVSLTASATTICAGTSVTFTATASNVGDGTVTYNFKIGGTSVQNSTSNTFTSTTIANNNMVMCSISITGGTACLTGTTATSNVINMLVNTVGATPSVNLASSASGTICTGTSVTFTATASNVDDGTVTYNFKIGGISVQNNTSNTFTSTTLANGNMVTCSISITGGTACLTGTTATSNVVNMSVNPTTAAPSVNIAASPSSTIDAGTSVTFTATPTNEGTALSYQWKKNSMNVGTNSPTYTDAGLADGDILTCAMTSTVCSSPQTVTSNSITMTVIPIVTTLAVGIAIYPDPNNRGQLLVKVKPNLTVPNYLYSAAAFTVKYPTAYNTSLSVGSSTYGFTVSQNDATGSDTYFSFSYVGSSFVNWVAGQEVTVAVLKHSGSCTNPGVFEIVNDTWTAAHNADYYQELNGGDAQGAIYQPIASIACMDITAPTFTRPVDLTINTLADCTYDASLTTTGDVTDEADNCSTGLQATYTDVVTNGSCAGSKTIKRTWHLADACGNTTDKVQTITVQDKIAPTFTCPIDLTIHTLANCTYDASPATTGDVTDEADNCSTGLQATYTDVVTNGSCTGSKTIKRTWHLADACGNTTDKVQTITAEDKTAPNFTLPADITINTTADCTYDISLANTGDVTDEADNCSENLQATAVDFVENGSCANNKKITRTWTLTDDCGNKTTKTQTITVIDNIKPTITAPSDISVNVNAAACSATVTLGTPTGVADNCTTTPTVTNDAPSVFPLGNTTVVWTATDACGNTKTATQIVTVTTTLTPTSLSIQNSSICSGLSTNLSFTISGGQSPFTVVYTEGGINRTITDYTSGQNVSVSPTVTTTYVLVSVTDAFGCTKTATELTATLTVTPTVGTPTAITGPTSVCQDDADATYATTATNSISITYSVSPADAGVINTTTGVMNWATVFSGTATITATATGCNNSITTASKVVTVNALPTLSIVSPSPVCLDFNLSSLVKTFSPAGGSFSYHASLADANSNSNPINSLATATNTYYVRYTMPSGCFTTSSASITVGACVTVASKVLLQGPYNTTTRLMNDNLRANSLIPTSDPYSDVSLNTSFVAVNNGGTKTTTSAVLAVNDQNAIVDWVFLELRDITTNTQVVATRSALVQRDGDIVDMDGVSPVLFYANRAAYYLVVRHRNHLGIMSATPIDYRTGTAFTIDFTSLLQATYGTNARKQVSTGIMSLWGGNANLQGSGATRLTYNGANNDRVAILNRLSGNPLKTLTGYYLEDVNMDGIVKYNNSGNDRVFILNNLGLNPLGVLTQQIP